MTLAPFVLIVAVTMPSPTASPLKEIYHATSTPFCTVYRENVFRAVQGLMINDAVIAKGGELLAAMGRDPYAHGMAQYRLGQIVYETASNLTKVYQLLDDADRFRKGSTADEDRDLLLMKARLQAVADAQERSLNVLSGTYETGMLTDLMFKSNELNASLAGGNPDVAADKTPNDDTKTEKTVASDAPLLRSGVPQPGQPSGPAAQSTPSPAQWSLSQNEPAAQTGNEFATDLWLTGQVEKLVAPAVLPSVNRCK